MEARKLVFPIVLAMVWVVMAAMAIVDFASFSAATQPQRPAVAAAAPATHLIAAPL
jgi:hypothetical protein